MAAVPAEVKRSTSFSVRYTAWSRSITRVNVPRKSDERWWIIGCAVAASTSGAPAWAPA